MQFIVIDIGGTNIKYGVATYDYKTDTKALLWVKKTPTEAKKGGTVLIATIKEIVNHLIQQDDYDGIAISSAGQIDPYKGSVIYATEGIPNYTGIEVKEMLEATFNIPVTVENDVNSAALGEVWCHDHNEDFIALTLGTGIGGAIIHDGKILHGHGFSAGEFGHMALVYDGIACNCGQKGCFERYASSSALDQMIQKHQKGLSTEDFFEICKSGSEDELAILDQWLDYLSEGIRSIVHIFNPSLILIGGGITQQGSYLEGKIENHVKNKVMSSFSESLEVKFMINQNDANLYGALFHHLNSRKILQNM